MSLVEIFMELDKLYEASMNRQACIDRLEALGKNYNFEKYSDAQIYRMLEKAEKEKADNEAIANNADERHACGECGCVLTDSGLCPVCNDGEEHYN